MSFAIVENGQITVYQDKSAFTSNGVEYPKFWYVGALDFQRKDAGCKDVIYQDMADESLFWNAELPPIYDAVNDVVLIKHNPIPRPKPVVEIAPEETLVDVISTATSISSATAIDTITLTSASDTITISGEPT